MFEHDDRVQLERAKRCVALARRRYPTAPEEVVEDWALALMYLPDEKLDRLTVYLDQRAN